MTDKRFLEVLNETIRRIRKNKGDMDKMSQAEVLLALSYLKMEFAEIICEDIEEKIEDKAIYNRMISVREQLMDNTAVRPEECVPGIIGSSDE